MENNKYLEKASSLLATAVATHVGQNIITRKILSSPRFAKAVGDSFVDGTRGVVNKSLKSKAGDFIGGIASPDAVIAKNTAHRLGETLGPHLQKLDSKQRAALKMTAQGNLKPLVSRGYHRDPQVLAAAKHIETHSGLPIHTMLSQAETKHHEIEKLFNSKEHPLLSNVSKNAVKAKGSSASVVKPGTVSSKPMLLGAAASGVVDPAAGALNLSKSVVAHPKFQSLPFGKKLSHTAHDVVLKRPMQRGLNSDNVNKLKNKAYELAVSPVGANLERTSHALKNL